MWTEKQIESWLISETRQIPKPNGELIEINAFRLVWANYEFILRHTSFTTDQLLVLVDQEMKEYKTDVDEAFSEVTYSIYKPLYDTYQALGSKP